MSGPFKMKGSPMKRNFGISPMKQGDQPHTEREAWVKGLRKHSSDLKARQTASKKGDELTKNILDTARKKGYEKKK